MLVERDAQLDALTALLDGAVAGEGSMAHLLGPAGVGKTSLLRAIVELGRERGTVVLDASAGQLDARNQFGLARRLFDRALAALDPAGRAAIEGGPARRAAVHLLGQERVPTATPAEEADLIASLYWLLAGLAATGPMLVVADDVQWADAESLHFLGALRERLADLPVLVLTATRESTPEDRSPAIADLIGDRSSTTLRLEPLTATGVAALLTREWGEAPEAATAARVTEVSGGNPFLVVALARQLAHLDSAARTAERATAEVPDGVIDAVVGRLAGLPESDRALARAVAVLDVAPTRLAAALASLDLETAVAAADRLRAAGLLAAGPGLSWEHALIGSAVAEATGTERREQLHRQAATLLATEPGGETAAAAHLLASQGVGDPAAARLLATVAGHALADGAPHTAVALLRRAIAEPPPREALAGMLLALGEAEATTADPAAVDTLRRAEAVVATDADRCRCALALARVLSYDGQHDLAADVLERALTEGTGTTPERELEIEAALVAAASLVPERIADARRRLAARRCLTGATRGERLFLVQQLSDAVGTNQPAATIRDLIERVLDSGRRDPDSPDQSPESTDWVWARLYLVFIGEFAEARRQVDAGFRLSTERGSVIGFITTSFVAGQLSYCSGAFVEAEAHFRTMLDVAGEAGGPLVHSLAASGLAQSLAMLDRVDEALDLLEPFPEDWPVSAPVNATASVDFSRAITRQAAGDHEGALRAARSVGDVMARLDIDSPTWAAWREVAIEPLLALGRVEEARSYAAEHLRLCEAGGVVPLLGTALRLSGLVASDPAEGIALLRRSVDVLAGAEAPFAEGVSRIALGAALRRGGSRRKARAELQAGRRLVEPSGAVEVLAWADDELTTAGSRPDPGGSSDVLTPAERRVAELAATGMRNQEIARALFLSVKTIETHLSSTYRKLGIPSRDQLAATLSSPR